MAYAKGQSGNPNGRPKGSPNKLTRTVREAFEETFELLQENPGENYALGQWAKKNPDKFYLLAQKLIPTQVQAQVEDVTEIDNTTRTARLAGLVARLEARAGTGPDTGEDLA